MTTALVTGASSGLGAQFCRELAARGHDVVLVARDRARLEAVAAELSGVRTEILVADLADRAALQLVADRVGGEGPPGGVGHIDLLVNNAGFGLANSFLTSDVDEEERLLDVMCRAVLVLSHAAGRAMSERGRGGIINVSSIAGFVAMGSYSAAKAWVTTFSEALRQTLAPHGVVVTALCPGFIHTEFQDRAGIDASGIPGPLWLDAADVVRVALADAHRGRPISVPGAQYRAMVAGLRLAPRRLVVSVSSALARGRRSGSPGR